MEKQFQLTYNSGVVDPQPFSEMDVVGLCPVADEEAVLELEIGESHRDRDGDTWERTA